MASYELLVVAAVEMKVMQDSLWDRFQEGVEASPTRLLKVAMDF